MTSGSPSSIPITPVYASAFVLRCHELVGLGYTRLTSSHLNALEEEDMTGKLRRAMEAALDAPDRPEWATLLMVVEEQRENVHGKTGKRRPRIDICITCINPRPATHFRFEAKRLRDGRSLTEYLGETGMLALLTGYYGDLKFSAMIGYVQRDTCDEWAAQIKKRILASPAMYHAEQPVRFDDLQLTICSPVFCSRHRCGDPHIRRQIAHTLLLCA